MVQRLPLISCDYRYTPEGKRVRMFTALGWEQDGKLLAGVLFDSMQKPNICMHIVTEPGWMNRDFIREAFRYPFIQLGCGRVTGKTPLKNKASLTFQKALGFKVEGRVRQPLPDGDDLIITGMLKSECKWLEVGL